MGQLQGECRELQGRVAAWGATVRARLGGGEQGPLQLGEQVRRQELEEKVFLQGERLELVLVGVGLARSGAGLLGSTLGMFQGLEQPITRLDILLLLILL